MWMSRATTSTSNSGATAIVWRASLLSLDLPFLLLELDFAELLFDFALALLEVGLTELLDFAELLLFALLEAGLTELLDFAELLLFALLELDLAELEEFGGFTDELLVTLLELSGLIGSKWAVMVVSLTTVRCLDALVFLTSSSQ